MGPFTRLSLAYFRRHVPTSLLTLCGVALGVAVFLAISLSGRSLNASLRSTIDQIAGKAQLEVSFGEGGVPEETVERLQALPEISVASPVIQAVVRPDAAPGDSLLVVATDLLGDRTLREYDMQGNEEAIDDPLVFLAQPDSIALTRDYADRLGLKLDDPFPLTTPAGRQVFKVRGLIEPTGIGKAYGGALAMMDIYAAQLIFARGRRFDRIDILLRDGVSIAGGEQAIRAALGPGWTVETPSARSAQMETLLANFQASLQMSSIQALLIGIFLIYNIFSVAVARRRAEIGTLRALGATRGEIAGQFLAEAAVLGAGGTLLGLWAGRLLAGGAFRFMRSLVEEAYGINQIGADDLAPAPGLYAIGIALGLSAALLAAWWPARRAARIDPVAALAGGSFERAGGRLHAFALVAGAGLVGGGLSLVLLPPLRLPAALPYIGLVALNLGAVCLAPAAVTGTLRLMRRLAGGALGAEGRLAFDALLSAPRRTVVTAAALMIATAFVINSAGFAVAFQSAFDDWLGGMLNADLYVSNSERFMSRAAQFPPGFGAELAAIPGVRTVEPVRSFRLPVPSRTGGPPRNAVVLAGDFALMLRRIELQPVAGDKAAIERALIDGSGIAISDNLALVTGWRVGDEIPLASPTGPVNLRVAGVIREYSSDQGSFFMSRAVLIERWGDTSIDTFDLMLDDPGARLRVKAEILDKLGRDRTLFVFTGEEFRGAIQKILDRFFGLGYLQVLIAIVVAVMGIANTLLIGVYERRRELGLLKALGAGRGQVMALIGLEAGLLTLTGTLLGFLHGALCDFYSLRILAVTFGGWLLPFEYPVRIALAVLPLLLAAAAAAALYPALLAQRVEAAQALQYE